MHLASILPPLGWYIGPQNTGIYIAALSYNIRSLMIKIYHSQ